MPTPVAQIIQMFCGKAMCNQLHNLTRMPTPVAEEIAYHCIVERQCLINHVTRIPTPVDEAYYYYANYTNEMLFFVVRTTCAKQKNNISFRKEVGLVVCLEASKRRLADYRWK